MFNFQEIPTDDPWRKRWVRVVEDDCYISVLRSPYAGGFFAYETAIVFAPAYHHPPLLGQNQVLKLQGDHRAALNKKSKEEVFQYGMAHVERYGNF